MIASFQMKKTVLLFLATFSCTHIVCREAPFFRVYFLGTDARSRSRFTGHHDILVRPGYN